MALDVKIEKKQEGAFVVSLIGSLDSDTYIDCEEKLKPVLESETKAVVFNMEGLTYISSAGLGVVFKTKQTLEKKDATLAIANLQPNVKKVFEAVKVLSEALFATLDGSDEQLDRYINHIISKDSKENNK